MDSNVRAGSSPASSTNKKKSQSKALAFFVLSSEPSLLERVLEKQKSRPQAWLFFFQDVRAGLTTEGRNSRAS